MCQSNNYVSKKIEEISTKSSVTGTFTLVRLKNNVIKMLCEAVGNVA